MSTCGRSRPSLNRSAANRQLTSSAPQAPQCLGAIGRRCTSRHRKARDPGPVEHVGHVLRVRHRHAEPQRPHLPDVGDLVDRLVDDLAGPCVVAGIDVVERAGVVASALPLDTAQVDVVVNAEVVEGHQQIGAERIPQPQLVRAAPVEVLPDVDAVGPLRCGGQTEQFARVPGGPAGGGRSGPRRGGTRRSPRRRSGRSGSSPRRRRPATARWRRRAATAPDGCRRRTPRRTCRRPAPRGRCAATARGSPGGARRTAVDRAAGSCAGARGPGRRRPSFRCRSPPRPDCGGVRERCAPTRGPRGSGPGAGTGAPPDLTVAGPPTRTGRGRASRAAVGRLRDRRGRRARTPGPPSSCRTSRRTCAPAPGWPPTRAARSIPGRRPARNGRGCCSPRRRCRSRSCAARATPWRAAAWSHSRS